MPKPKRYTVSDGKLVLTLEVAEEGGYIVTSPFDPDVLTQAESLEEAFENARDVIALFSLDREEERKARGSSRQKAPAKWVVKKAAKPTARKYRGRQQANPA